MTSELAIVHAMFHISMLICLGDPSLILPFENIGTKDDHSFEEVPIKKFDCLVCKFRTKEAASVKILWINNIVDEYTL